VPVPRRRAAGAHDLQKGLLSASLPWPSNLLNEKFKKRSFLKEGGFL
jgi:hypothetical protein